MYLLGSGWYFNYNGDDMIEVCRTCEKTGNDGHVSYMICPDCIEKQKKELGQQRFKITGIYLGENLEVVEEVVIHQMKYYGSHGWEFKAYYEDGSDVNDGEWIRGEEIIITRIEGVNV